MRVKSIFAARLRALFETVFKGQNMRKQKPETFPAAEFGDRLDALLAAASGAGMRARDIVRHLEQRAANYRRIDAVSANLSVVPKLHDGWGRPIN
jgi:hypothetical protein